MICFFIDVYFMCQFLKKKKIYIYIYMYVCVRERERERERERDLTQLIWSIRTADFLVHHIHLFTIYVTVENL